ncbi:MAG: ATP-binding cassette domain-containing protein [Candidatus Binatia bacterium]
MAAAAPIAIRGLSHAYGTGELRKQILFDVTTEIASGEIVIVTGPSGGGKTTLLTLVGALRATQEGSLHVLGQELRGARRRTLETTRKQIGFVFQAHNLIEALTALQNVEMALHMNGRLGRREVRRRAQQILESVGLSDRMHEHPSRLSGGQRQRVAIARALVTEPKIVLADEPTASLDKQSGREVIDIMQHLARARGATIMLVTHDSRILDVADRIVHLEDGRLSTFTDAVIANNQHMMHLLAADRQKAVVSFVEEMSPTEFGTLLQQVTSESRRFLDSTALATDEAFRSMLDRALRAFTRKLGQILDAERASLFLVDPDRDELWLTIAQEADQGVSELRISSAKGVAGYAARTGETVRVDDAYADPRFDPGLDRATGFRTRSILCVPLQSSRGEVFAVSQLLNRRDGRPFDAIDEQRFIEFLQPIAVMLETWWRMTAMSHSVRNARGL